MLTLIPPKPYVPPSKPPKPEPKEGNITQKAVAYFTTATYDGVTCYACNLDFLTSLPVNDQPSNFKEKI
jgi:hypothetical protein